MNASLSGSNFRESLVNIQNIIRSKFPRLKVVDVEAKDGSAPCLHIFKASGTPGLEFMPFFHVIAKVVTVSNSDLYAEIVVRLYSFHGKLLDEVYFPLDSFEEEGERVEMSILADLEGDRLHLCQGVQEVRAEKLDKFFRSCKEPTLEKVKNLFFIEGFCEATVVRSRLCKFVVNQVRDEEKATDFARCSECTLFHRKRKASFFTYLRRPPKHDDCGVNEETVISNAPRVIGVSNGQFNIDRDDDDDDGSQDLFERVHSVISKKESDASKALRTFQALEQLGILPTLPVGNGHEVDQVDAEKQSVKRLEENGNLSKVGEKETTSKMPVSSPNKLLPKDAAANVRSDRDGASAEVDVIGQVITVPSERFEKLQAKVMVQVATRAKPNMNAVGEKEENKASVPPPRPSEESASFSTPKRAKRVISKVTNSRVACVKQNLPAGRNGVVPTHDDIKFWNNVKKKSLEERLRKQEERKRLKAERAKRKRETVRKMPENSENCTICLHAYSSRNQVTQCMKRHEEELSLDLSVPCPICCVLIENKRMVTQHFAQVHVGQTCCCECMLVIPNENNRLRRHIIKKHHTAGKPVICPHCGRSFTTVSHLKVHLADHNKEEVVVCHQCGQTFNHRRRLMAHMSRLHQPRNLKCVRCEKTFENRQQARRHLTMHTGIKPFKCADCNYCAYKLHNIHTHVNKTHGRKSVLEDVIIDEDEREIMMQMVKSDVDKMVEGRNKKVAAT